LVPCSWYLLYLHASAFSSNRPNLQWLVAHYLQLTSQSVSWVERADDQGVETFRHHPVSQMADLRLVRLSPLRLVHNRVIIDGAHTVIAWSGVAQELLDAGLLSIRVCVAQKSVESLALDSGEVQHLLAVERDQELRVLIEVGATWSTTTDHIGHYNLLLELVLEACSANFERNVGKDSNVVVEVSLTVQLVKDKVEHFLMGKMLS